MDIKFSFSSEKYNKINNISKSLKNRIIRLENAVSKSQAEMVSMAHRISIKEKLLPNESMYKIHLLSESINDALSKQKNNVERMDKDVLEDKLIIENELSMFSNQNVNQGEIKPTIDKNRKLNNTKYNVENKWLNGETLVSKISHNVNFEVPKSFKESIIQVNNEIVHINGMLLEMRTLTMGIIEDYNQVRLGVLYENKEENICQLLIEQIVNLKPVQEMIGAIDCQAELNERPMSLCSCGGRGRTAFC